MSAFIRLRHRLRRDAVGGCISVFLFLACLLTPANAELAPDEAAFARAYELETAEGKLGNALQEYYRLAEDAPTPIAHKALFRAGACEMKMGLNDKARQTWLKLIDNPQLAPDLAVQVSDMLARLIAQRSRVKISGKVLDESGSPVAGAYVVTGGPAIDPPVLTREDGSFAIERKLRRHPEGDFSYCFVYAEHPLLNLSALSSVRIQHDMRDAVSRGGMPELEVALVLQPSIELSGTITGSVITGNGSGPMPGTFIEATALTGEGPPVEAPLHLLLPRIAADSAGAYNIAGLPRADAFDLTARGRSTGVATASYKPRHRGGQTQGRFEVPDIRTHAAEPSGISGIVTDPDGNPLRARISGAPLDSGDLIAVHAETGNDGRYTLDFQDDGRIAISAQALENRPQHVLVGISAGAHGVDFVLSDRPAADGSPLLSAIVGLSGSVAGSPEATELSGIAPNWNIAAWISREPNSQTSPGLADLRGSIVILHFASIADEASTSREYPGARMCVAQVAGMYRQQGVVCVWILPDEEREDLVRSFLIRNPMELVVGMDRLNLTAKAFRAKKPLANVVIARDGTIHRSGIEDARLFRVIKGLLATEDK